MEIRFAISLDADLVIPMTRKAFAFVAASQVSVLLGITNSVLELAAFAIHHRRLLPDGPAIRLPAR